MIKNLSQLKKWMTSNRGKTIHFISYTKGYYFNDENWMLTSVQSNSFSVIKTGKAIQSVSFPKAKDTVFNEDGTIEFMDCGKAYLKFKPIIKQP